MLAATFFVGCANGGAGAPTPVEPPPGSAEARALVERLNEYTLDVANRSAALGQAGREAELRVIVHESFDVPHIARATLGGHWDTLSAEQRKLWTETYEEFHIVAMAFNWRQNSGARFEYLGEAPAPNDTILVKATLDRAGQGVDVRRDCRLRRDDRGWRIIDVYTPGYVSIVGMRRSEYLTVLSRVGFDGLIEDMRRRIAMRRAS